MIRPRSLFPRRCASRTAARHNRQHQRRFESLEHRFVLDSTVVFSEVMYNPGADDQLEWLELHNEMAVNMDISQWRIDGIEFEFPSRTVIPAGGYLVVAKSPTALASATGFSQALGPYTGQLSNGGEQLLLINNNQRVMDALTYDDAGEWPVGPDGSGASLAKINPDGGTQFVANWTSSTQIGGTPGARNFTTGPLTGPTETLIAFDSNWRYDQSGTDYGTDWLDAGFDPDDPNNDGSGLDAWGVGAGLLGNETASLAEPIRTPVNLGVPTYYMRTEFNYEGNTGAAILRLASIVDDGAVFYLNGQEVSRFNMPAGTIEFTTPAVSAVRNATNSGEIRIPTDALVQGTNVLSVEVHQAVEDLVPAEAVILTNGGLTLVEEGPVAPTAGSPAPDNLARLGTPFALDQLSDFGHLISEINDGLYGNPSSWIGNGATGTSGPFVGINLGATPMTLSSIAFGRSNVLAGDPCGGGVCTDRTLGLYRLQYTTTANPNQTTPDSAWTEIGTLNYQSPGGTNFGFPHRRHLYSFNPVQATGIRLIVPTSGLGGGTAIDEIELYGGAFTPPYELSAEGDFSLQLESEGEYSSPLSPALVPDNLVLSTPGASTFGSGELTPGDIGEVADGRYGDANAWSSNGEAPAFIGIDFGGRATFDRIAFGRDNGDNTDPGCAGGVCTDNALGTYTLQLTDIVNPETSTPDTGDRVSGWETIGTITYNEATGNFAPHLRHEYLVLENGDPLSARGIRILVSDPAMTIDEIEVSLTPEPQPVVISPSPGFNVNWDGNDGDFFDEAVPPNLALASGGTVPFGSGELGAGIHLITAVNDGLYGNSNSWIGSGVSPNYIGLNFGGPIAIDRIAWGRDNGNMTTDACGGQCADRSLGTYTLQYTTVAGPGTGTTVTGDASTGWRTVAEIRYDFREDAIVGGGFTEYLRHEFSLRQNGDLLTATGIRLIAPSGTAIDELEIFGPEDPDVVFGATLTVTELLPDPAEVVFSEVAGVNNSSFFVEIANQNAQSVDLTGYIIASSDPAKTPYTLPPTTLPGNGFTVVTAAQLGFSVIHNEKLFLYNPARTTLSDAVVLDTIAQARSDEYSGRWLTPDTATPGAENQFDFERDIVINEIMYHAPGTATSDIPAVYNSTVLLPIDAATPWRYRDVSGGLPSNWASSAHSVGTDGWKSGPGLIGYETGPLSEPIRTQVANPPSVFPFVVTYYFEREFTLDQQTLDSDIEVTLSHFVDDGAVFYVNGVELSRFNMPEGPITGGTFASSSVDQAGRTDGVVIPREMLIAGTNRISAEVHQGSASSSDVVFGVEISLRETISPFVPGVPYTENDEEFLELYNRGTSPVDVSGWTITDAVDYTFPPGTVIAPGGYLVVARDATALQAKYPGLTNIAGSYDGSLGNGGDVIRLWDAIGNPADEVTYFDSGRWSETADGGGSSLELLDPFADNSQPEAWRASDESADTGWQTITYREVLREDGFTNGITNRYREFIAGMLDAGVVLIDDVSVVEDPDGAAIQRIQNGDFEADTIGSEAAKWRINGTHSGEVVIDPFDSSNQVLEMTARGPWEDRYNHAETTFVNNAALVLGTTYEISFRAKWVSGSNQLNTHLYFDRLSRTTLLERTSTSGTPGAPNSVAVDNLGPTYTGMLHAPAVPNSSEPVTVSISADDHDGVNAMTLWYSVNGGTFQSVAMTAIGDGDYQGIIPGQAASRVVQFYVEGEDGAGATSFYPAAGPNSRALYKVQDGLANDGDRHNFRIVMTQDDVDFMHSVTNSVSNDRLGATIIYNESEIFYDAGVRLKGSNAGRNSAAFLSYNVAFDSTKLFRGVHDSVAIDRSGRSGPTPQTQDEILIKHIGTAAGGAAYMYDDIVQVIAPNPVHSRPALLMLASYDDVFLDSQFEDGSDGTVFKMDIAYVPNGTIDGNPESLKNQGPYSHPGPTRDLQDYGDDKEAYRSHLLIRNNRAVDDYSGIIAAAKVLSLNGNDLREAAFDVIDVDQWARVFALQSLTGAADVYTRGGLHHNIDFYVRPSDNRVLALPWDWDFAFTGSAQQSLVGSDGTGGKLMNLPGVRRMVYGHLLDLINTTFNNEYMDPWIDHYGAVAGQNLSPIKGYITARRSHVLSQLPAAIPFEVTTNGGADFQVSATSVVLTGRGWIDVHSIRLPGVDTALPVTWGDDQTWQVTLPLVQGANSFTLTALDYRGAQVGSDTISVTSTLPNPVVDQLRITEINYNPLPPSVAEATLVPGADNNSFEFVELLNTGSQTINLTGVQFTRGISLTLGNVNLAAGQYAVVVRDRAAFEARYGTDVMIAGVFGGALNNGGEELMLQTAAGVTIADIEYSDNDPFAERADGLGATLEAIDPATTPAQRTGKHYQWRGSSIVGGTPGAAASQPVGVVINEVLSHTELPERRSDSIELFNTTNAAINISGWWLSDSSNQLNKFVIPPGTILGAGSYIVFDESDFNPTPATPQSNHFALDAAHGDDVWLVIPNGNNQVARFADEVHFGATANSISLSRIPDGAGRLAPASRITLGVANASHHLAGLVISEVNYNPGEPSSTALAIESSLVEDDLEFVELVNVAASTIDLDGWQIAGGVDYHFGGTVMLSPGEVIVILSFDPADATNANRTAAFRAHYGIDATVRLIGGWSGQLSDSGEELRLERHDVSPPDEPTFEPHVMEDVIFYDDLGPWPVTADGSGMSLSRVSAVSYGGNAASWTGVAPSPGTVSFPSLTAGDFTGEGTVSVADVDIMVAAVRQGSIAGVFDLDGNGVVTQADAERLIVNILGSRFGDANLDGAVDATDLQAWTNHAFTSGGGWSQFDFNGDGVTDASDFNIWNANKFQSSAASRANVSRRSAPRAALSTAAVIQAIPVVDEAFKHSASELKAVVFHTPRDTDHLHAVDVGQLRSYRALHSSNVLRRGRVEERASSDQGHEQCAHVDDVFAQF